MIADLIIGFSVALIIFSPFINFIRRKNQNNTSCKTSCKGDCRFCYTKNNEFKK